MKKNEMTKMQRKTSSRRNSWTNAERFVNKQRNLLRQQGKEAAETAARLLAEAEKELASEANPEKAPGA